MVKLAKYLKPFLFGLALTIILLFGQAMSELNLPKYMAEIVNVGIQQGGIEHAAPEAMSAEGFRLMTTLMTEKEKQLLQESYALVSGAEKNADGKAYDSLYPGAGAKFYVQKEVDSAARENLDRAFGTATWTLMNLASEMRSQAGQAGAGEPSFEAKEIDITALYQVQPMLDRLPESAIAAAREKAMLNDEGLLRQSGIMLARAFYSELGLEISGRQTAYILKIGLVMLVIALLGGAATVLVGLLSSRISAGVARDLRKDLFTRIEGFSNREFDQFGAASLITRCTNDVTQIQMLLMIGIRMICYAPIIGIGGVIMAVNKSASMSWILAAVGAVLVGLILVVISIAMPKFKIMQKLVDRLNLVSRENLSGLMVIRAFGTQKHEQKRFGAANEELTETNLFVNRVMVFMMPVMMLVMNGVSVLVIWVGAGQIANSAMQVGDMMAFMQYAMQVIMAFLMLSMIFVFVPRAAVSAGRIAEVLGMENSVVDPESPAAFQADKRGLVEFEHVHFRYQGAEEDALRDITFTARPGETTAIIGPTGSGKSTIARLILRFYDVSRGQIIVGGADVRQVKREDLRAKIGYAPQKGALLAGTIASNISYGQKEASDSEVETAAEAAQAMEFIAEHPDRFAAEIAQGGANVSGGQKQRLSIARALARQADIYIFDDSFSALDFRTDAALRKGLKKQIGGSTVMIIAQRVGTIMHADQIIVLDQGQIVGRGTHRELLKKCPQYYEIASSQLAQEELA